MTIDGYVGDVVAGELTASYEKPSKNIHCISADSLILDGYLGNTSSRYVQEMQLQNLTIKSGAEWDCLNIINIYKNFTVEEGHNFDNSAYIFLRYNISDSYEEVSNYIKNLHLNPSGEKVWAEGEPYAADGTPLFTVLSLNGEQVSRDSELSDGADYDFDKYTLTLNNATLTGGADIEKSAVYAKGDLNINLKGDNIITSPNGGISVVGTKKHSGVLTFTGDNTISEKSVIEIDNTDNVALAEDATLTNNGIVYLPNVSPIDENFSKKIPTCLKKEENGIANPNGVVILSADGSDFRWLGADENGEQKFVRDLTFTGLNLTDDTLTENTDYPAGLGTVSFKKTTNEGSDKPTATVTLNNASFYVTKPDAKVKVFDEAEFDYACAVYAKDMNLILDGTADTISVMGGAENARGIFADDSDDSDNTIYDLTVNAAIGNMNVSSHDNESKGIVGENVNLNGKIRKITVNGSDTAYGINSGNLNIVGEIGNIDATATGIESQGIRSRGLIKIDGKIGDITAKGAENNTDAFGISCKGLALSGTVGNISVIGSGAVSGIIRDIYPDSFDNSVDTGDCVINISGTVGNITVSGVNKISGIASSGGVLFDDGNNIRFGSANISGNVGDITVTGNGDGNTAIGISATGITIGGTVGKITVSGAESGMGLYAMYADITLNTPITIVTDEINDSVLSIGGNITLGDRMVISNPSGGKVEKVKTNLFEYSIITDADSNSAPCVTIAKLSGGGGSSSTTTTTSKNDDGSTTQTTTNKITGTVTEVTTNTDGSTTKVETKKDGTVTTTETRKDGTTIKTKTSNNGETSAEIKADGKTEVLIPAKNSDDITKVILTDKDGNKTEVEFEITNGGVMVTVSEDCTVSLSTEPEIRENKFSDVDTDAWYFKNVEYVIKNGLMNGITDTTFAPNDNLTRAMLVTILYRAAGKPAVNKSIPFDDVDMGGYYANAVIWAKQNNIVSGHTENEFAPDDNITREQIATIIYRYASYKGVAPKGAWAIRLDYADIADVADYAGAAVMYCTKDKLMTGKDDNMFCPKDYATRAEIAAILQRFIESNK